MTTEIRTKPPLAWRVFLKLQNPFMKRMLRSPLHFFVSRIYMLVTFTGRKSGKVYSTPVQYGEHGETFYVITSSGYTWWKNLRGGAEVELRVRGKAIRAYAETSADPQIVGDVMGKVYPSLDEARKLQFIPGKVALTFTRRGSNSRPNLPG